MHTTNTKGYKERPYRPGSRRWGAPHGLLAAGACLLGNAATAGGPPIGFDGYSVNGGTVAATCPPGGPGVTITCEDGVSDNGMLQRKVTVEGGPNAGTYLQFILTDPGATGDAAADPFSTGRGNIGFTNEDFIRMNNRGEGIASKQSITESDFVAPDLEDRFVNTAKYDFGWAQNSANPWVELHQQLSTIDYSADPMNPKEIYGDSADIISNADGFNTNRDVKLAQLVDLDGEGVQKFHHRAVSGLYQLTSHPSTGPSPLLPGGTNGGDITWATGDSLTATWVGQEIGNGADAVFGYTRYANVDQASSTHLTSLVNADAVNWISPPFGTVEAIADVPVIAPTAATAPLDPFAPTFAGGTAGGATTPVALPVAYNGWTVSGGLFTTDACPSGVECAPAVVNEGGLLQRSVYVGGEQYIQTIVTDASASGDPGAADFAANSLAFHAENFIKVGTEGLAANLHIAERDLAYVTQWNVSKPPALPSTAGQMVYDVTNKTGWANGGPADPRLSVDQQLVVPDNYHDVQGTVSMYERFRLDAGVTDADRVIDMQSALGTHAIAASYSVYPGAGFQQPIMFESNLISGAFQNATHTLADAALLSDGGNIAWAPGDAIQATWVGGYYSTSDPADVSTVGTTSYSNLTAGSADRISYSSVQNPFSMLNPADPSPDSWVSPFRQPAPVYYLVFDPTNPVF